MKFKISNDGLQRIADETAAILQKQIRAGIDANGSPFAGGVDLRESDRFLDSIAGELQGDGAVIVSDVNYAEVLQERYNWAGIAPQFQSELESNIQPILEETLELLDED